jgi:vacuolar-type H+-ATPase subunit H
MLATAGNSGEAYIHSLKQIKELEDKVQTEIDSHRKRTEEEMAKLDLQLKDAIAKAKSDGEKMVETSVEQARKNARKEADKVMAEAKDRSLTLRLNPQATKQVIEILLSGLQ